MDTKPRDINTRTNVLVHCRSRLLCELIARTLSKRTGFHVIPCEEHGKLFQSSHSLAADVIIFDSLDLFLEETRAGSMVDVSHHRRRCLLIAMNDDHADFLAAIRAGARGYVLHDAAAVDVLAAIRTVSAGEVYCPSAFLTVLFDCIANHGNGVPVNWRPANPGLTRREQQLIPLIGQGLTNKEIATNFNLSECTVKNHVHRILKKTGAASRLELFERWQNRIHVKDMKPQASELAITYLGSSRSSGDASRATKPLPRYPY